MLLVHYNFEFQLEKCSSNIETSYENLKVTLKNDKPRKMYKGSTKIDDFNVILLK